MPRFCADSKSSCNMGEFSSLSHESFTFYLMEYLYLHYALQTNKQTKTKLGNI